MVIAMAAIFESFGQDFGRATDRKSTRLNSSHSQISYAVFCLKKNKVVKYLRLPTTHINQHRHFPIHHRAIQAYHQLALAVRTHDYDSHPALASTYLIYLEIPH